MEHRGGRLVIRHHEAEVELELDNCWQVQLLRGSADPIAGYKQSFVLNENDSDAVWLLVVFEDRASYDKNANDPAQHERFMEMRGLLEADPEWHDGMIMEG